jgi:multidrug efflux system outer membrane protein
MKKMAALSMIVLGCSSCCVGPNYRAPTTCVEQEWASESLSCEDFNDDWVDSEWWHHFQDPLLTVLIEDACSYNYDVRIASARLMEARANRLVAASPLFPKIDFGTVASDTLGGVGTGSIEPIPTGTTTDLKLLNYGFDALWELDFFGRTRRQVEAANASFQSTFEVRNDVLVSVCGELAFNYVQARGSQAQIEVLENTVKRLQLKRELVVERERVGIESNLSVQALDSTIQSFQAQIPPLYADVRAAAFRISVLTGRQPIALLDCLLEPRPLPQFPCSVAVGAPSELLRRRPDIRRAERDFAADTALVGSAVANLFPRITLTGSVGWESFKFGPISQNNQYVWGITGIGLQPIFHGGEIIGNIQIARAKQKGSYLNYQKTVLEAFEEAEKYMSRYVKRREATDILHASLKHQEEVVVLTKQLYDVGMRNYVEYLDTEIELADRQEKEVLSRTQALVDLVALYKALGGGWYREEIYRE